MKLSGKRIVGNLQDTFDEAGDGNGAKKSYRAVARPYPWGAGSYMTSISPRVCLPFKKLFGVEENKDLLVSLINSIVGKDDFLECQC